MALWCLSIHMHTLRSEQYSKSLHEMRITAYWIVRSFHHDFHGNTLYKTTTALADTQRKRVSARRCRANRQTVSFQTEKGKRVVSM